MIFGDYPCCGGILALAIGNGNGRYAPHKCEHCGATVWTRFSRLIPESWTEEEFHRQFVVNEETKSIEPRDTPSARANFGANHVRNERQ